MEDARSHMAGPVRWERDSWCFPGQNCLQLSFGGRRGGVQLTCNGNGAYDVGEYTAEFAGLGPRVMHQRLPQIRITGADLDFPETL